MRSPFPGMDPYLETRWSSFHVLMISAVAAVLKRVLPDGLQARPEEDVRIQTISELRLGTRAPDVAVVEARRGTTAGAAGSVGVAEPVRIAYYRRPIKLRRVQIVDARRRDRVVTAIEILSPLNKAAGRFNRSYRKKLRTYERAEVNWVEIDLLRSSRKRLVVDWDTLPPERRADYLAVSYRAATADLDAYPLGLRARLPVIEVPLRGEEERVPLDLQAAFERAWDDGPFDDIDYAQPADPPLSPQDAAWLAGLMPQSPGG